jgi:hypothetical protein
MRRVLQVGLAAALFVTCLQGENIIWTNPAGGDFMTPGNWDANRVPGVDDVAVFNLAAVPYTVTWSASVANLAFVASRGTVTWNLQGNTYSHIANPSVCTIGTSTSAASLTITNGTVTYSTAGYRPAIIQGNGTVLRVNQAQVTLLYPDIKANATVIADGTNTVFGSYGYMSGISGALIITNNARLAALSGTRIKAGGLMVIAGTGSGRTHEIALSVFEAGSEVRLLGGAVVKNSYVNATHRTSVRGTLTLDNARLYDIYSDATLAAETTGIIQGRGELGFKTVENAGGAIRPGGVNGTGRLLVKGDVTVASTAGSLPIELGGAQTEAYDQLALAAGSGGSGILRAGGVLRVACINGFQPAGNDTFKILDFAAAPELFDILDLPTNVPWDIGNLYVSGEIRRPSPGLATPVGVTASDGLYANEIRVVWNVVGGATGYSVWRAASPDFGGAANIGMASSTTYVDTTVTLSMTNWYWIKAVTATQISALSSPDAGMASGLSPPSGVTASDGAYTNLIRVAWDPVIAATGYKVWRSATASPDTAIRIGGTASFSLDDLQVAVGVTNWYWVQATNATHTSILSTSDMGVALDQIIISDFSDPAVWSMEASNPGFGALGTICQYAMTPVTDAVKGSVTELTLVDPPTDATKINMQCVYLKLNNPVTVPFVARRIGLWIKGNSSWGLVNFMFTDANGETFRTAISYWDRKKTGIQLAVDFDDWCFLSQELPVPATDDYRDVDVWYLKRKTDINGTWSSTGGDLDRVPQYPITVSRIGIGLRDWQVYVTNMIPATSRAIRLGPFLAGD